MDAFDKLAQRSHRMGWLSLLGALLVFISMGYSYFTIHDLNDEINKLEIERTKLETEITNKKENIIVLDSSINKLQQSRNSAAALLLDILNIENQFNVDNSVSWESFREQLLSMPSGKRQESVLTAILLAWKDIPFNIKGKRLLEGFSSPNFIEYVLKHVGVNVQKNKGERLSETFMRVFQKSLSSEPGDIVCYKGAVGNFCLLIINTDKNGVALAGIGTLETVNPLGIYAMENINEESFPLLGYFKVPYPNGVFK